MNPWNWEPRHRVALLISAALGALITLVVGYTTTGSGHEPFDWLFDFGYRHFRLPESALWLVFGLTVGGGIFYVWRISVLSLPEATSAKSVQSINPVSRNTFLMRLVRELAAGFAFLIVFAVICLPLVFLQRQLDRRGVAALPFEVDAQSAALLVGGCAALTALLGIGLGRWAYDSIRSKPTADEAEAMGRSMPKWLELLLSMAFAGAVIAFLAFSNR